MINLREEDELQSHLFSTRYSVLQNLKSVSQSLNQQKQLNKLHKSTAQSINKKLLSIEYLTNRIEKQSNQYLRRLNKLEKSQTYAIQLMKIRMNDMYNREKQLLAKKQNCSVIKEKRDKGIQESFYIANKRKQDRLQMLAKQQQRQLRGIRRSVQQVANSRKLMASQIKDKQTKMKNRRKQLSQHQKNKARDNYLQRAKLLLQELSKKKQKLNELEKAAQEEEMLFKKTQQLDKQIQRVKSRYLKNC